MGRVLSEAATLAEALPRVLKSLGESEGMTFGAWWELDAETGTLRCAHTWSADEARSAELVGATRDLAVRPGQSIPGVVWASRRPCHDRVSTGRTTRARPSPRARLHAAVAFPLLREDDVVGVVEVSGSEIPSLDASSASSVAIAGRPGRALPRAQPGPGGVGTLPRGQPGRPLRPAPLCGRVPRPVALRERPGADGLHARPRSVTKDAERWWREGIHPGDLPCVVAANRAVLGAGHAAVEFRFRKEGRCLALDP